MSGIMIDKDATVEWLKSWGENTPHMDGARIIEAQDAKITALEAENAALRQRLIVDDAMAERALQAYLASVGIHHTWGRIHTALEAALGKEEQP